MNELIQSNINKFNIYYQYLIEENEKYNLTGITKEDEVYIKHFLDSIMLGNYIDLDKEIKICDIGSGAGFPAIPLKICFPKINVTIIEPTKKRVNFMNNVIQKLKLTNIEVILGRAEELASIYEEQFDIVTARAVANLSSLLELITRLSKTKGKVIAYKGDKAEEEIVQSQKAINELNLKLDNIYSYDLPNNMGKHTLIVFQKEGKTNQKYPRRYSEIKNKPL